MRQHPTSAHDFFRTTVVDELQERLRKTGAQLLDIDMPSDGDREFTACEAQWKNVSFCYSYYGAAAKVHFPARPHVTQQFCLSGSANTVFGDGATVSVTPETTCIVAPMEAVDVAFAAGVKQMVLRIDADALARKRSALIGTSPDAPLLLHRSAKLDAPEMQALHHLVQYVTTELRAGTMLHDAAIAELEQAIMVFFLLANHRDFHDLLEKQSPRAAPWQVRMAEQYIEANFDQPITLEALAAASGTSTRSLLHQFRQSRGYSPMAFAKRVRLDRARELLQRPDATTSVTSVAAMCGFHNLGHFAKDYFKAFGERPSETLAKRVAGRVQGTTDQG
jgi:AraC-like DNA-binding protein